MTKMKVVEISSDEEDDVINVSDRDVTTKALPQQGKDNAQTQPPPFQPQNEARPTSAQGKRGKKPVVVEAVKPPSRQASAHLVTPEPPPSSALEADVDVKMDIAENGDAQPDVDVNMDDFPKTPERPKAPISPPKVTSTEAPAPPAEKEGAEPHFVPALSKLPFTPITRLSEAELDMTVEDWIRYQMDAEFDKFRRDGERELQRFLKKAEEARNIIENL
jgi:cytoskeletal protein RodZ